MAKIKIDLDPVGRITFQRTIQIPTADGSPLRITFDFVHRTREQMAELMEQYVAKARESLKEAEDNSGQTTPAREAVETAIRRDTEAVMDVAAGWNVEGYAFNAESLAKLRPAMNTSPALG